jgi:hypothetical protein
MSLIKIDNFQLVIEEIKKIRTDQKNLFRDKTKPKTVNEVGKFISNKVSNCAHDIRLAVQNFTVM